MTSPAPGVAVGGLLKTRPDAFGLDLELLAGSGGLDRRITNLYVQKTAILVEIAARNQLLRARGHHAARPLTDRLERQMQLAGMDDVHESEIDDVPETGEEP